MTQSFDSGFFWPWPLDEILIHILDTFYTSINAWYPSSLQHSRTLIWIIIYSVQKGKNISQMDESSLFLLHLEAVMVTGMMTNTRHMRATRRIKTVTSWVLVSDWTSKLSFWSRHSLVQVSMSKVRFLVSLAHCSREQGASHPGRVISTGSPLTSGW